MLYQYKPTGQLVEMISHHGDGVMMCVDSQDEVLYIDRDDLPKIKEEIEKIESDPEVKKIIDLYKNDENFGFSDENIEKHAITKKAMEDYADLLLGKQIYDYFDFDPERYGCEITAEY